MGQDIVITKDEIILKHRFYDLIIPKQSAISFWVRDYRSLSGLPVYLHIEAEKHKTVSRFFVGKIVYWCHRLRAKIYPARRHWHRLPNFIYFEENIRRVLTKLKEHDYPIGEALLELERLEGIGKPKEMVGLRRALGHLVIWGFISGAVVLGYVCGISQTMSAGKIILISLGWIVICAAVFHGLRQMIKK